MPTEKELAMQRKQEELQQLQPAATVTSTQTKPVRSYLADYSKDTDLAGIAKKSNVPLQQVFTDYQQWGRDTGNQTDFLPMWTAAQNGDITKTPEQIEKEKKKAERQERWEQIGNVLSHLGNFVGAVGFGAPSQTIESAQELTKRQQDIRDRTEALRNAYNKNFFEAYSKQRAQDRQTELDAQNYEIKKAKSEIERERLKEQQRRTEIADFNAHANKEFRNASLELKSRALDIREAVANGQLSVAQGRLALSRLKEDRLAGGTETSSTVTQETPFGKQTTTTTKTTRPAGSSRTSTSKPAGKKLGIGLGK